MSPVWCYRAYGLRVRSSIALGGFPLCEAGEADIDITAGPVAAPAAERDGCVSASPEEALLHWRGIGSFLVRGGREIIVDANAAAGDIVRLFVLGPVLAVALHQRGLLVLHASAVLFDGEAVGFLGQSGSGKSTTAAALHGRGRPVITDDLLVVGGDNIPCAYPGSSELKLWPDIVSAVKPGLDEDSRPYLAAGKRIYSASRAFAARPVPVRCLYVLDSGDTSGIEGMSPHAAFVELIRHTFTARLIDEDRGPLHFLQCAGLASRIPVRRITSPPSLEALAGLASLVEQDLAAHAV